MNAVAQGPVKRAKRCETCQFMEREKGDTFCHRSPPTPQALVHIEKGPMGVRPVVLGTFASFPPVTVDQWCGEWQQRRGEAIVETTGSIPARA